LKLRIVMKRSDGVVSDIWEMDYSLTKGGYLNRNVSQQVEFVRKIMWEGDIIELHWVE